MTEAPSSSTSERPTHTKDWSFAQRPLEWREVKEIVQTGTQDALAKLRRSEEQARHYVRCREEMLQEYASVTDAVKIKILRCDFIWNDESRKQALPLSAETVVFAENNFPYCFESGIEHHVVWSDRALSDTEVEDVIAQNRQSYDVVWFRNPPPLQTIRDLWHIHVVSYPRSTLTLVQS